MAHELKSHTNGNLRKVQDSKKFMHILREKYFQIKANI